METVLCFIGLMALLVLVSIFAVINFSQPSSEWLEEDEDRNGWYK